MKSFSVNLQIKRTKIECKRLVVVLSALFINLCCKIMCCFCRKIQSENALPSVTWFKVSFYCLSLYI